MVCQPATGGLQAESSGDNSACNRGERSSRLGEGEQVSGGEPAHHELHFADVHHCDVALSLSRPHGCPSARQPDGRRGRGQGFVVPPGREVYCEWQSVLGGHEAAQDTGNGRQRVQRVR